MSDLDWYEWQPPSVSKGKFSWVTCRDGEIPEDANAVGKDDDGSELYAGRARHEGDLLPAKVKANHGAYVTWGGEEHFKNEYQVLVSNDIDWQDSDDGEVTPQAMVVGQTINEEDLYLGIAFHEGTTTPGKVHPTHGLLYIPYKGEEKTFTDYKIMVLL